MRGIGVEESAAICAELLDRLLTSDRTDRNDLFRALKRCRFSRAGKRLRHSECDERDRDEDRER